MTLIIPEEYSCNPFSPPINDIFNGLFLSEKTFTLHMRDDVESYRKRNGHHCMFIKRRKPLRESFFNLGQSNL